jgi:hypothetical protein
MPALIIFLVFIISLVAKNLFGIDLFPVLIVYLAVKGTPEAAVTSAALAGFIEDILFYPGFIYFLSYSITGGLAVYLKRFFSFEEEDLILVMVLILTPVSILLAALGLKFFQGAQYPALIFNLFKAAIINAAVVLIVNYFYWRRR